MHDRAGDDDILAGVTTQQELVDGVGERINFKKIPMHMQDHGDA